ncbi:MAG: hypothetical protein M1826_005323 [Phylliscum demangeonii]|nr:MAG: hypothetical protein M1826_005323 [Phylliscum demangeonii]
MRPLSVLQGLGAGRLDRRADCKSGTSFYRCALNNYHGCCSVDACQQGGTCPDDQPADSQTNTPAPAPAATPPTSLVIGPDASTSVPAESAASVSAVPPTTPITPALVNSATVRSASSTPARTPTPDAPATTTSPLGPASTAPPATTASTASTAALVATSTSSGILPATSPAAVTSTGSSGDHKNTPTGAIVGGVLGGAVGLIFLLALLYLCCWRRRREQKRARKAGMMDYAHEPLSPDPNDQVVPTMSERKGGLLGMGRRLFTGRGDPVGTRRLTTTSEVAWLNPAAAATATATAVPSPASNYHLQPNPDQPSPSTDPLSPISLASSAMPSPLRPYRPPPPPQQEQQMQPPLSPPISDTRTLGSRLSELPGSPVDLVSPTWPPQQPQPATAASVLESAALNTFMVELPDSEENIKRASQVPRSVIGGGGGPA